MGLTYTRDDFEAVPGVPDWYFCPGCNSSADDHGLPSIGCPCDAYGSGNGALTLAGVLLYLAGRS